MADSSQIFNSSRGAFLRVVIIRLKVSEFHLLEKTKGPPPLRNRPFLTRARLPLSERYSQPYRGLLMVVVDQAFAVAAGELGMQLG